MTTDPDSMVFGEDEMSQSDKRAFITGITGQDGSYLAELLLSKGYEVHGLVRRTSVMARNRIDTIRNTPEGQKLHLHYGDVTESGRLSQLLMQVKPHEVYHLAAQSQVRVSFDQPEYTNSVVAGGALNVFSAVRGVQQIVDHQVRVYNAGSSEMFGAAAPPQNEATPFHPRSPYGVAKLAAHWHAVNHRESYGIFIANGILFNHESPRRGENFVTRKITKAVGRIALGLQDRLVLGNIAAMRDWGYAADYVEAMWHMLQQESPDDFVIATGKSHSVEDFLETAFAAVGLPWNRFVSFDADLERPAEVDHLCGDFSKARDLLQWKPRTSFKELVKLMMEHDLVQARREKQVLTPP
jgi:GDPmannose 4,6-dehydratase